MDPTLIGGAMSGLAQGLAGAPSAATASQGSIGNQLDGSGWTVSTGKGSVGAGATITKPSELTPGGAMLAGLGNGLNVNLIVLAVLGLVAVKVLKK